MTAPTRRRLPRPAGATTPFLLRLPAALRTSLSQRATDAGLSLNAYCVRRLAIPEATPSPWLDVPGLMERADAVAGAHVLGAVVHGSTARGEARRSSDVDVLIVVDRARELTRALYRHWDATRAEDGDRHLDAHFVHLPADPATATGLWCEAAVEGIVVADPHGLVSRTLIDVRRAIAAGLLIRKQVHGQPYWTVAA